MTAPPLQRTRLSDPALAVVSTAEQRLRLRLASLASHLLVALVALVAIGGATRVMQAGLACPDWPLCYGSLLPSRQMNLQVFLEWFHRLDAFVVGVGLLVMAGVSLHGRRQLPRWQPPLALAAVLLVVVQGGLGALTVLQLLPAAVVTAHLLTALLLVALLSACHQGLRAAATAEPAASGSAASSSALMPASVPERPFAPAWLLPAIVGLVLLAVAAQSVLGGLMASQWAAGRCLSAGEGCSWLLAHRQLARPVAVAVLALAALLSWRQPPQRRLALLVALLVALQVALGVLSLRLSLAVPAVIVAHQVTAALLVAVLAALLVRSTLFPPSCLELSHG
jgi:cytochrome c oxidase assembly protein subunit 15